LFGVMVAKGCAFPLRSLYELSKFRVVGINLGICVEMLL